MTISTQSKDKLKNIVFYVIVILLSVSLPVILDLRVFSSFVGATRNISKLQEFFGLSGFLAVIAVTAWEIKQNRPADFYGYIKILIPAIIALLWLNILSESTLKDWDYICYEDAAQFLLNGKNPYQASLDCYYYPPLLVLIFSWVYTAMQSIVTALRGLPLQYDKAWMLIFYLYQCVQWFLVIVAYFLCIRLAEKFGLNKILSLSVVTLLFILNNPLLRTLHFFQINLWVLNIVLLILLFSSNQPFIAGLLAALGTHIKLYPAVFVVPWSLLKNWKALLGFTVGIVALLLLITGTFGNISIWTQFINNDPTNAGGFSLRDNSLHSFIYNLLRIATVIKPDELNSQIPELLTTFIVFMVVIWFMARMIFRYRKLKDAQVSDSSYIFYKDALFVDMVGLMLLVSPVAWEHHYVLVIPVILWTFAYQIKERQVPVASVFGFLFIFALPTFDVFPLSYLRVLGLLILLIKSDPILSVKRFTKIQVAEIFNF